MERLTFTATGTYARSIPLNLIEGLQEEIQEHMGAYGFTDIKAEAFPGRSMNGWQVRLLMRFMVIILRLVFAMASGMTSASAAEARRRAAECLKLQEDIEAVLKDQAI